MEKVKKLTKTAFYEITDWIYRNARPLDLEIWKYHFENGNINDILTILQYYQNSDGGFGKIIDPDNWNPASTAYNAQIVIKLLRGLNFIDINHSIYKGIIKYLENTNNIAEYGWLFTIPSNNDFPCGVWWKYSPEHNTFQSIGTTASLCGFILRYLNKDSTLYNMADKFTVKLIERLKNETEHGDMGVNGYLELLEDIKEAKLEKTYDTVFLSEKVAFLIREKILKEKDNFMANPLEFITSEKSIYYDENKNEVENALDVIIESRIENNVWNIPWEWYNEHTSSKNFAISENWWKAAKAIEKLMILRNFNRLE